MCVLFAPTRIASSASSAGAAAPWRSSRSRATRPPPTRSAFVLRPLMRGSAGARYSGATGAVRPASGAIVGPGRPVGTLASHAATSCAAAWPACQASAARSAASGLRLAAARSRVSASPPFAGLSSIHSSYITVPVGVTR